MIMDEILALDFPEHSCWLLAYLFMSLSLIMFPRSEEPQQLRDDNQTNRIVTSRAQVSPASLPMRGQCPGHVIALDQ